MPYVTAVIKFYTGDRDVNSVKVKTFLELPFTHRHYAPWYNPSNGALSYNFPHEPGYDPPNNYTLQVSRVKITPAPAEMP